MTQRSILAGDNPTVVVKVGRDVKIEGWDGDRVEGSTDHMWGMKVERRDDAIHIELGKDGLVRVPRHSALKLYVGRNAEVQGVTGSIPVAQVGHDMLIRDAESLGSCSAGGSMDFEVGQLSGSELKLTSGRHLRCHVHDLENIKFMIKDMGGYWEMTFGEPARQVRLQAGGDVTLVIPAALSKNLPDIVGGIEIAGAGEPQKQG